MEKLERRSSLLLTHSFASALARLASGLEDPEICDEHLLLELLALADRAEVALKRLSSGPSQEAAA